MPREEAEGGRRVEPRRLVRRGLKEWGWKMELTLQDDRGAITFKIICMHGAYLHWFCECVFCFTTFNSLGVRIERIVV